MVIRIVCVLATIRFHDQLCFPTYEIGNVAGDRFLPHKLEAFEPAITQRKPEFSFSVGMPLAQTAFDFDRLFVRSTHFGPSSASQLCCSAPSPRIKRGEGKASGPARHS